jgi:hypothetical protein
MQLGSLRNVAATLVGYYVYEGPAKQRAGFQLAE